MLELLGGLKTIPIGECVTKSMEVTTVLLLVDIVVKEHLGRR